MARQTAKVRSTSKLVATKPACAPLFAMYQAAEVARPRSWTEIEDAFVAAMSAFDANVASGVADIGDLQNGKGDFFNDLLALLLENCAGVSLYSRGGVPGFVFANHNLDLTYPNTGVVRFTLEAKAVGTPRHPKTRSSQRRIPLRFQWAQPVGLAHPQTWWPPRSRSLPRPTRVPHGLRSIVVRHGFCYKRASTSAPPRTAADRSPQEYGIAGECPILIKMPGREPNVISGQGAAPLSMTIQPELPNALT